MVRPQVGRRGDRLLVNMTTSYLLRGSDTWAISDILAAVDLSSSYLRLFRCTVLVYLKSCAHFTIAASMSATTTTDIVVKRLTISERSKTTFLQSDFLSGGGLFLRNSHCFTIRLGLGSSDLTIVRLFYHIGTHRVFRDQHEIRYQHVVPIIRRPLIIFVLRSRGCRCSESCLWWYWPRSYLFNFGAPVLDFLLNLVPFLDNLLHTCLRLEWATLCPLARVLPFHHSCWWQSCFAQCCRWLWILVVIATHRTSIKHVLRPYSWSIFHPIWFIWINESRRGTSTSDQLTILFFLTLWVRHTRTMFVQKRQSSWRWKVHDFLSNEIVDEVELVNVCRMNFHLLRRRSLSLWCCGMWAWSFFLMFTQWDKPVLWEFFLRDRFIVLIILRWHFSFILTEG